MAIELAETERTRAISAHALYLANLLLLPGLAFVVLWWYRRHWAVAASAALRRHLDQAFGAALWSGALIVLVSLLLVLLGAYALSRAMAGLPCRYPLPGLWRQS